MYHEDYELPRHFITMFIFLKLFSDHFFNSLAQM